MSNSTTKKYWIPPAYAGFRAGVYRAYAGPE